MRYSGESNHVNIDEMEMKDSESESRYAFLYSLRATTILDGSNQRTNELSTKKSKNKRKNLTFNLTITLQSNK